MTDRDPTVVFSAIATELAAAEQARLGRHACPSAQGHRLDGQVALGADNSGVTGRGRCRGEPVTPDRTTRGKRADPAPSTERPDDDPHAFRRLGVSAVLRPAFSHDCDRILHSRAYTRYIDKTQVFSMFENDNITHRVLHVQLVARIARSIARALRLNEDLTEAIALGHDLGHAPYGHDGESYLHSLATEAGVGTFRHNAQSVRTLMVLEAGGRGLNLTVQTLDGILAHNGELLSQEYRPRYDKTATDVLDDLRRCFTEPDHARTLVPMTLEGCVVRICDVIAYIGRDIEDAILLGVVRRDDLPADVTEILGNTNEEIIDTLVSDLVMRSHGCDHLVFGPKVFAALRTVMDFNYRRIYLDPRLKCEGIKIERMFRLLFLEFMADLGADRVDSPVAHFMADLPPEYKSNTPPARIVIDFIAGMTDDYFNHLFRLRFMPQSFGYHLGERKGGA